MHCPKDLQACPKNAPTCPALLIVAESSSTTDPLGLDDCHLGPTEIELELDPPQKVLGYEYWDNEHVPTKFSDRSFFRWRNVGSTSCWGKQAGSSTIHVFKANLSYYIIDVDRCCIYIYSYQRKLGGEHFRVTDK